VILAPDDLLPSGPARWTREAVGEAWATCRRALRAALADPTIETVVCLAGAPASGKSTWTRDHDEPGLVVFDACWAEPGRRRALAQQIRQAGKVAIAVWVVTPLEVCRERNAARPPDRHVPDGALTRSWLALRECPPSLAEGWSRVLVQDGTAPRVHDDALPPERQLERLGQAPANQAWALARGRVLPAYREAMARLGERRGAEPPPRVAQSLRSLARALERGQAGDDQVGRSLGRIGARVERAAVREVQTLVGELVPGWTAEPQDEAVSDWAERVGQQVADVRRRLAPGIDAAVAEAWRKGWTAAELERHWKEHGLPLDGGGTAEGQGSVLAHDAHAGLVQEATRAHQESAGLDWYEWEHNPSAHPRPEHVARHGQAFQWSKPPADGHPGTLRNCRCRAVPLVRPQDVERLRAVERPAISSAPPPTAKIEPGSRGNTRDPIPLELDAPTKEAAVAALGRVGLRGVDIIATRKGRSGVGRYQGTDPARASRIALGQEGQADDGKPVEPLRILIEIEHDGTTSMHLRDGNHRAIGAREAGATHHVAEVVIARETAGGWTEQKPFTAAVAL